ncbi:MAG: TIGR03790 family protein [Planctomycetota bacterium]|nr:TIGR03790 family protein [Planctomycetota bacterium]
MMLLTAATVVGNAYALTPQEVLVVANAKSQESVSLANFYAEQRRIPRENIFLVNTTTKYHVLRDDYETQIRRPLMEYLREGGRARKIRCICLMWGVPVRVTGMPKGFGGLGGAFRIAARKAHYRLAVDYQLLGTVGVKFPPPQTDQLTPIGKLFASPMPEPKRPLMKAKALLNDINRLLAAKQTALSKIEDPAKRQIASRQLMALRLDIHGLKGLIKHISANKSPDAPKLEDLRKQLDQAEGKYKELHKTKATTAGLKKLLKLLEKISGVAGAYSHAQKYAEQLDPAKANAAVDSELALLWWGNYRLLGPLPNVLHWRKAADLAGKTPPVLMTARIDGPSCAEAMRIIKTSLAVEKVGLKGSFYIDAGGKHKAYDAHLAKLYSFVQANTKLKVKLDEGPKLFAAGSCPDAGLYVGWYSLRKYVPAFNWNDGAVGWHIASMEAMNLRNPNSREWCVKMLQNGVTATIGAVQEPYLGAFPLPEDFFGLLLTGKWTVAECYWRTNPMTSWQMTLIADPLYNPFAVNPQIRADLLPKGLAPQDSDERPTR